MASPPAKRVRKENLPYIHEHIIFSEILPLLSFDELAKLKCVCKSWCSFISSNPMLPLDRFRRCHDVSSSYLGVVFPECYSDGQLVFLQTLRWSPLDVVLSVSFSPQPCEKIVACTNGLLCLKCSSGNDNDNIYYVCNPLTKEGHIVPLSNPWRDTPYNIYVRSSSIGLAYDPSKSPAQYKLVCPLLHFDLEDDEEQIVLGFEVFSSQTNKWDKSCNYWPSCLERRPLLNHMYDSPKSTYAGGVLYWNCLYHLIYFDPEKDYGGIVHFPFPPFEYNMDYYDIGEFKGHLTLSRVSIRGMQLWILHLDVDNHSSSTGRWELMHQVSFETVIETNRHVFRNVFCLDIPPPKNREEVKIMFKKGLVVIHLPYGGGGRLFMRVSLQGKKNENVLCYDVNSGKILQDPSK